jgi:hypothetical protein
MRQPTAPVHECGARKTNKNNKKTNKNNKKQNLNMEEMLEELLVEVLSFLEPVDLLHLAAVDARLHRVAGTLCLNRVETFSHLFH